MDRSSDNSARIAFSCPKCGRKLTVPETHAGKQGRCPKCRERVTVPPASGSPALYDLRLLDVPPSRAESSTPAGESAEEAAYEQLQTTRGGDLPGQDVETPRRKLPWIIDIFLYPANKPGLSVLLICVGGPFLLRIVARFFMYASGAFGPLLVFWALAVVVHWGGFLVALLYVNWYLCECIRDSAEGGLRAADTTANTPGLGEILGQALKVILSVLVCMAPAVIYWRQTGSADDIFRALYGAGGFLIPMAVLAMAMYDGLHGLNPALLLGSILRTFLPYCALVVFGYVSCLLVPIAGYFYIIKSDFWMFGSALLFLAFYQLLVLAHLLGRFYWRHDEKLNWSA